MSITAQPVIIIHISHNRTSVQTIQPLDSDVPQHRHHHYRQQTAIDTAFITHNETQYSIGASDSLVINGAL